MDRRRRAEALEKARAALDKVIVKELGSNSNVRNRLTTLNGQLKQQMNRIIEHRSDGLTFHHKAIDRWSRTAATSCSRAWAVCCRTA